MPHLFAHRDRAHHLGKPVGHHHHDHRNWEFVNAYVYLFGGVVFIIGSLLLFPRFEAYGFLAGWVFVSGSLIFLAVSAHDFLEVLHYRHDHGALDFSRKLELWAAISYVFGGSAFCAGRIMFIASADFVPLGAWFFIFGSAMFLIGASINVAQILDADSLISLQFLNATAITYIAGSLLFLMACIPYIWHLPAGVVGLEILNLIAGEFLVGSLLFFAGGLISLWRVRSNAATGDQDDGSPEPL